MESTELLSFVVNLCSAKHFSRLLLKEICEMTEVVLSTGVNVERISLLERCCISGEGESMIPNNLDGHKIYDENWKD